MPTPPTIDLDALLAPIAGGNPSGVDLAYEGEYDQIREARRADDDVPQGDWERRGKPKVAEWDKVITLGSNALIKRSKDLQVAAWIAEALARKKGFAGLRDGFLLLKGIQDAFWDTYYPIVDDGDVETRFGPFLFLNRTFPVLIRSLALTDGAGGARYSFLQWQTSRSAANLKPRQEAQEGDGEAPPDDRFTAEVFDKALAQTKRLTVETLAEDAHACLDAFAGFDQSTDDHFGRETPGLTDIRRALDEVVELIDRLLDRKREQEPWASDRAEEPEPEPEDEPAEEVADEEPEPEPEPDDEPAPAPKSRERTHSPRTKASKGGPIADADDARGRIAEAASFLRKAEPEDPAGYLVARALRMAGLFALDRPVDLSGSSTPSPDSDDRRALRRLAAEDATEERLDRAEDILSRPEGLGWLDPHRHAVQSLESLGRSGVASAARAWIGFVLENFPEVAEAELSDGTPAADGETRAWIRDEGLTGGGASSTQDAAPSWTSEPEPIEEVTTSSGEPDPWDRALELNRAGRASEAIELIRLARAKAESGRERFLRTLQLAELCGQAGQARVALHLAEELDRQIDEHRLETWESPDRLARAWSVLCQSLRAVGPEPGNADRWRVAYARLCRLDVNRALDIGAAGPPG